MKASDQAVELFHRGYNCAQAVFGAFAGACGLDERRAVSLSAPFGAGIGRMREVCGAFNGLVLLYGFINGTDSTDCGDREATYADIQKFAEQFKTEFGTLYCRDLLGLSPDAPKETARPSERTPDFYLTRPCERCIRFCARLGERLVDSGTTTPAT